jgi:LacI family transcriptional regulator
MRQKVTLQSVADELGISKSTVSRAFGKPEILDKDTVKRILSAAGRMGYRPNISAKNLAMGGSRLFAVLVPDLNYILGDFLTKILYGIELEFERVGSSIMLSSYGGEQVSGLYSKALLRADVSGAVVFSKHLSRKHVEELSSPPVPTVLVDIHSSMHPCVYVDNFKIGWAMAEHLLENGHRNLAIMPGDARWLNASRRRKGILSCLKSHGIDVADKAILPCRFEHGFRDATDNFPIFFKSFPSSKLPTAIIAGNDEIAAGIFTAAREMGLCVPEDISVIGCDNNFFCDYLTPPLTSVEQNGCEIGIRAAQMLTGAMASGQLACEHKIIVRKSVSRIQAKPYIRSRG